MKADETKFFVIGDWGGVKILFMKKFTLKKRFKQKCFFILLLKSPVFPFRTVIEKSISHEMENLAKIHDTQFQGKALIISVELIYLYFILNHFLSCFG